MPIDSRPRDAQVRPMPSSASTRRFFLGRPPGALPHSLSHSTLSFASASSSRTFLLSTRALFFALFCSRSARNVFPCRPPCVSKPHTGAQLIPSSANMSGTLSVHTDECNEGDEGSTCKSIVAPTPSPHCSFCLLQVDALRALRLQSGLQCSHGMSFNCQRCSHRQGWRSPVESHVAKAPVRSTLFNPSCFCQTPAKRLPLLPPILSLCI